MNEPDSHSGWGAPWGYARDAGFVWTRTIETGSHAKSAAAIAPLPDAAYDAVSLPDLPPLQAIAAKTG